MRTVNYPNCLCCQKRSSASGSSSSGSSANCYLECASCPDGTAHSWTFTASQYGSPFDGVHTVEIRHDCYYSTLDSGVLWELQPIRNSGEDVWQLTATFAGKVLKWDVSASHWECQCPNTLVGTVDIPQGPQFLLNLPWGGGAAYANPPFPAVPRYRPNDLLVALVTFNVGTGSPLPTPTGWTQFSSEPFGNFFCGPLRYYLFYRRAAGDASDILSWTALQLAGTTGTAGIVNFGQATGFAPFEVHSQGSSTLADNPLSPGAISHPANSCVLTFFLVEQLAGYGPFFFPPGQWQVYPYTSPLWTFIPGIVNAGGFNLYGTSGVETDQMNWFADGCWAAVSICVPFAAASSPIVNLVELKPDDCIGSCSSSSSSASESSASSQSVGLVSPVDCCPFVAGQQALPTRFRVHASLTCSGGSPNGATCLEGDFVFIYDPVFTAYAAFQTWFSSPDGMCGFAPSSGTPADGTYGGSRYQFYCSGAPPEFVLQWNEAGGGTFSIGGSLLDSCLPVSGMTSIDITTFAFAPPFNSTCTSLILNFTFFPY